MFNTKELKDFMAQTPVPESELLPEVPAGSQNPVLSDLWQPEENSQAARPTALEDRLCELGHISSEQMEQARSIHRKTPRKRLGQILLEMGVISEANLMACLAEQYGVPFVRVTRDQMDMKVFGLLDKLYMEQHQIIPLGLEGDKLVVATTDPTNVFLLDEVKRKTGKPLAVRICPSEDIKTILQDLNAADSGTDYQVDDIIKNIEENDVEVVDTEDEDIADMERIAGESPIIKFVNYIIFNAVKEGASDIHIEPGDKKLRLRYRIDGVLFETVNPPYNMHAPIVSRIKIMANLDIAERRLPQDGRIRVSIHGRNVDMRVSTLPSSHGEKVVIRILDTGATKRSMTDLGFDPNTLEILNHQIHQPHGIILVTGPTGSGKSTTLYSALRTMDIRSLNVSTVEDPVEYQLEGITQVQVHERIGMTFSAALRSLLRQDPDVIMVGEIRDAETARIAVQASLTGHLVLSTLHTNDAPSSITRLINIGIESYLIAASTNAVLAQRLVRKICPHCKQPYEPKPEEAGYMEMFGFNRDNLFHGAGCEHCRHTGYQGRIGLYELLVIDDKYRDVITGNPNVTELRRMCKERGMTTLREDGFNKVRSGMTTIDEVMRVTECTI